MATMNISLPAKMKAFVDKQLDRGGYGTSSEYVRDLIRRDEERQALRGMLLAGAASPLRGAIERPFFERLSARVKRAR